MLRDGLRIVDVQAKESLYVPTSPIHSPLPSFPLLIPCTRVQPRALRQEPSGYKARVESGGRDFDAEQCSL